MIVSGRTLRRLPGMIRPFHQRTEHKTGLTYGVGPAGYDVRIAEDIFLGPQEFRLASILEHLTVPPNMICFLHDKSTWARRGLSLFNTVFEPGWHGYGTIEMFNASEKPLAIACGTPIAQLIFHMTDVAAEPYTGRYQNQKQGPQPAIMTDPYE